MKKLRNLEGWMYPGTQALMFFRINWKIVFSFKNMQVWFIIIRVRGDLLKIEKTGKTLGKTDTNTN